jgi:hypothetical protein
MNLVDRLAAWGSLGKFYARYSRLKARKTALARSKMRHYASFGPNTAGRNRNPNDCLKGNRRDAGRNPERRGLIKVYDWSNRAADLGQCNDWRIRSGFIGHDGLPWLWEEGRSCWLPVTESSRASRSKEIASSTTLTE